VLVSRNLSYLSQVESTLSYSRKLAALSRLTSGIAHEIKNPLNFVNNFAKLSKRFVGELREILEGNPDKKVSELGDDVTEILEELTTNSERIFEHGQRADSIVRGMLLHSRGDSGARVKADLNAVVDEAMNLAYHGMRATNSDFNTTLVRDFDKAVGEVEMVSQEISRVCLNLFNNAMYIVHERADESGPDFEPTVTARTKRDGDKVLIIISDNGKGMPEEVSKRIFEPFFTTKPAGQGTGLGLSMSYDIVVEGHHGSLVVDSAPGQGAQFTITLPAPM
jgi:signal transduction histidine kinase